MSKITENEIIKIAKLAKLNIDSGDLSKRVQEFNDILTHIEKLNELKLDEKTLPKDSPKLEMFDDQPRPSFTMDEVLKNAPSSEKPFFYIPRVIEGGKS
jgi:aspartyl-tRNA(Asn)/glutamyl-tRNA(Gln) amidotransferase subunit C